MISIGPVLFKVSSASQSRLEVNSSQPRTRFTSSRVIKIRFGGFVAGLVLGAIHADEIFRIDPIKQAIDHVIALV